MDTEYIENVASSLVREYLSRKGLKMTLEVMDEEMPRGNNSISNRLLLMKAVHLEKLVKRNKDSSTPFKAMLEVMAKYFIDKAQGRPTSGVGERHKGQIDDADNGKARNSDRVQGHAAGLQSLSSAGKQLKGNVTDTERTDIVIDDDVEGETVLGDGRAGLIAREKDDTSKYTSAMNRPKSKMRGMAGPIASNTDDRDRRNRIGRLKGSTMSGVVPSTSHSDSVEESSSCLHGLSRNNNANIVTTGQLGSALSARSSSSASNIMNRESTGHLGSAPSIKAMSSCSEGSLIAPNGHDSIQSSKSLISMQTKDSGQITNVLDTAGAVRGAVSARFEPKSCRDLGKMESVKPLGASAAGAGESIAGDKSAKALRNRKDDPLNLYGVNKSCVASEIQPKSMNFLDSVTSTKAKNTKFGDLEFGDVDDLDNDVANLDLQPRMPMYKAAMITESKPIDIQTAVELKQLVLGSASTCFSDEWIYQSFTFCDLPRLQYGFVQKKGGPCGILAAVQACMLQELLFGEGKDKPSIGRLVPSRLERSEALAIGLAKIFWRAGVKEEAVVVIPSNRSIFNGGGRYRPDNLTETLVLNHFKNFDDLRNFMLENIAQFEMDGHSGVILALYSTILSRTIPKVREDMDEPTGKLMGQHGYCTQDMVNLLVTGQATSNVFNDYMVLDGGLTLKGVAGRCDVGLMSLFEHYGSCQVGTYYKTPKVPIWVVCSESHFSVLFCLRKDLVSDWRAERHFELYYYDGLAKQEEEIRLTISTISHDYQPPSDDDLVPPLELCIRTKWKDAEILWNGTEPLL